MKDLPKDIKVNNLTTYEKYLNKLIGEERTKNLFDYLGRDTLINASFGMSLDSGSAYDGSLIQNALKIADYACKINELLPENEQVTRIEIYKVALLQHIAKCFMYVKNDDKWEIERRGLLYKFDDARNSATLRCGEYSALILMTNGIMLNPVEYEALCIMDKVNSNDDSIKWYASTLSTVIRQANELVNMVNKDDEKRRKELELKKEEGK